MLWTFIPLYFKMLQGVSAFEVVAHRAIWMFPLCLFFLWATRSIGSIGPLLTDRKMLFCLGLSSLFLGGNWLFFVISVMTDNVLAVSLGYFINPLVSVLLAALVLQERLTKIQWLAMGLAATGVLILAINVWSTAWISLTLALLWAAYSLTRRIVDAPTIGGLTVEAGLLAPFFILYLLLIPTSGDSHAFGSDIGLDLLLIGSAAVTLMPLLLFNYAVTRLSFATLGILQFFPPSGQFLLAWLLFKEPVTLSHMACFALIWISLILYMLEALRLERVRRRALPI